ncbi:MAG: HigA family addiction module antitoxin [bacterium]
MTSEAPKSRTRIRRPGAQPAAAPPPRVTPPAPPPEPAPPHPGQVLLEKYLKARAVSEAALAKDLNVSAAHVRELVRGKARITADTALRLARVTGIGAKEWARIQQDWDAWRDRNPRAK